eukprot:4333835-Pyramimonas_sp.AAC.3
MSLLLCGYPSGLLREPHSKNRRYFPQPDWLKEKVARAGLGHNWLQSHCNPTRDEFAKWNSRVAMCSVIAKIQPGQLGHHGILTEWTQEAEALWNYLMGIRPIPPAPSRQGSTRAANARG